MTDERTEQNLQRHICNNIYIYMIGLAGLHTLQNLIEGKLENIFKYRNTAGGVRIMIKYVLIGLSINLK